MAKRGLNITIPLSCWKKGTEKYLKCQWRLFLRTHHLCNVCKDPVFIYILMIWAPKLQLKQNIVKRLILEIKSSEEEGDNNRKETKIKHCFFFQKRKSFSKINLNVSHPKYVFKVLVAFKKNTFFA